MAVSSTEAITGLKATLSPASRGDQGGIPATATVRYAVRGTGVSGLDNLLPEPPETVAPQGGRALVGVWLTTRVPEDLAPGTYHGDLSISADGLAPTTVAVELQVSAWRIPDPRDWETWIEMIQSPDTLALEYDVPLWSDAHFELIAESFRLIAQTGSGVVYIPLLRETNQGNEQSMLRWIRSADGSLKPDYTIVDRYLDVAQKNLDRIQLVVLYAWDAYLVMSHRKTSFEERPEVDPNASKYAQEQQRRSQQRWDKRQNGLTVTIIDEASGEAEAGHLPHYTSPESRDTWKPVYDTLRQKLGQRGLEETMVLGLVSDMEPSKAEVEFFQEVTGGLSWVAHSHYNRTRGKPSPNTILRGIADIRYSAHVYQSRFEMNPKKSRSFGWQTPELRGWLDRVNLLNGHPLIARHMPMISLTGGQRGIGRIGGDFWSVIKNRRGVRSGRTFARYPENHWRGLNIGNHFLAPGPQGPVATARLENLRESVQECETRIMIERALHDEAARTRLGQALAERAQELLDQHQLAMWRGQHLNEEHLAVLDSLGIHRNSRWPAEGIQHALNALSISFTRQDMDRAAAEGRRWFVNSPWLDRNHALFELAAEIQAILP